MKVLSKIQEQELNEAILNNLNVFCYLGVEIDLASLTKEQKILPRSVFLKENNQIKIQGYYTDNNLLGVSWIYGKLYLDKEVSLEEVLKLVSLETQIKLLFNLNVFNF